MTETKHQFCYLCGAQCMKANCHGTEFCRVIDEHYRKGMNQGSYIPLKLEGRFEDVERIFGETCKHLVPLDANKIGLPVAVLTYSGKGKRQALTSIEIWKADVGQVGKVYADIYLKQCLTDPTQTGRPIRFNRKGNRVYKIEL